MIGQVSQMENGPVDWVLVWTWVQIYILQSSFAIFLGGNRLVLGVCFFFFFEEFCVQLPRYCGGIFQIVLGYAGDGPSGRWGQ